MSEGRPSTTEAVPLVLGLPVRDRRTTWGAAAAVGLYYLLTMQRGLSLYDSPELAMVAEQLGLGHPTGQPLHTMLGWLVSRFAPRPLLAINALSAIAGALTIVPVMSLASTAMRSVPSSPRGDAVVALAVVIAALHPLVWEPSTRIEVYPLAVFACLWAAARASQALADRDSRPRTYGVVGVALGLAAAANPYCALGTALCMTPRLLAALAKREVPLRSMLALIPGGLVGLLPYVYVPWVAHREDVVVWGRPDTWETFVHYVTGSDYRRSRQLSAALYVDNVASLWSWGLGAGIISLLLLGALGYAVNSTRRGLGVGLYLLSILAFGGLVASNVVFAPDVLDYLGYLAVPGWLSVAGVALLAAAASTSHRVATTLGGAALLVVVGLSQPGPLERTRHLDDVTEVFARSALEAAPEDAIVIVELDGWIAPMWYLQEQERVRPDVVLLAYGLASSSWYWDHLHTRHPALARVPLRGGDRRDRVRRFLAANASRPVEVQSLGLAWTLGIDVCPREWLWGPPPECLDAEPGALTAHVRRARTTLRDGSPGTPGMLAGLAFQRGNDLQRMGRPRDAVRALISAAPASMKVSALDLDALPERSDQAALVAPDYRPKVALGHPARNLDFAARIAHRHGAKRLGSELRVLSQRAGSVRVAAP